MRSFFARTEAVTQQRGVVFASLQRRCFGVRAIFQISGQFSKISKESAAAAPHSTAIGSPVIPGNR
jgi:hypothetical protein